MASEEGRTRRGEQRERGYIKLNLNQPSFIGAHLDYVPSQARHLHLTASRSLIPYSSLSFSSSPPTYTNTQTYSRSPFRALSSSLYAVLTLSWLPIRVPVPLFPSCSPARLRHLFRSNDRSSRRSISLRMRSERLLSPRRTRTSRASIARRAVIVAFSKLNELFPPSVFNPMWSLIFRPFSLFNRRCLVKHLC